MTVRAYSSPEAFKQALERRLGASTKNGAEFARKRQLLVFDRFLARIVAVFGDACPPPCMGNSVYRDGPRGPTRMGHSQRGHNGREGIP